MTQSLIKKAKEYFYDDDYLNALSIFDRQNDYYGAGLCSLLLKNENSAFNFWKKGFKSSPGCAFGLSLLKIIHLDYSSMPTFFQTRAFLEVYINLFLKNDYLEWAENLISACDELYRSNPEAYKFIGRALYANGYFNLAITFCKRSLMIFHSDPEALLIASQCYFLIGELGEALHYINKIFAVVENYYPAAVFREVVKEEIAKKK